MLVAVAIEPIAAIRTWSPTCRPSIWMTAGRSSERSEASQAFISCVTAPQSAGKRPTSRCRRHALSPAPSGRSEPRGGTCGSKRSTIRLSAHSSSRLPSRSANSPSSPLCPPGHEPVAGPPSLCRRGSRSRYVSCPSDNLDGPHGDCRAPHTVVASSSIISAKASTPARRQNRSTLRWTRVHRVRQRRHKNRGGKGGRLELRILFPMVSFSLLGLQHPEPNGSRRATPPQLFNIDRDIPGLPSTPSLT